MERINDFIQSFLRPGPTMFIPIIIFIFGLIVRVKVKNALKAGLTIGIAFVATGLVINALIDWIQPVFEKIGNRSGFNTFDVGWVPLAALSWAWPYAFLFFPIHIIINSIMLWRKWTKTLNIDLWNVWHKPFIALLIIGVVGNGFLGIIFGFIVGTIQIIMEIKSGDLVQQCVYKITKIKNVTVTHPGGLFCPMLFPIDAFLNKFKFFQNDGMDLMRKSKKFGILFENDVLGFLLGMILGFIGWDSAVWYRPFVLGIQVSAALVLLPIVARFFVQSLNPITSKIQETMQKRYKDREIYVGLDYPIIAGSQHFWIAMTIWVPISIAYAFLFQFSGVGVFPLAMIINTSLGTPTLLVTGGNLRKMIVLGIFGTPLFLWFAIWSGPIITQGLIDYNLATESLQKYIDGGQYVSSTGSVIPLSRYVFPNAMGMFSGKINVHTIISTIVLPIIVALWVNYYFWMKRRVKNNYYKDPVNKVVKTA